MQVDRVGFKPFDACDAVRVGKVPNPCPRNRGGLLHHIAHLTGQAELSLAFIRKGFYQQGVAAHACPRKPDRRAGNLCIFNIVITEDGLAEHLFDFGGVGGKHVFFAARAGNQLDSDFPVELIEVLFKVAYARLPRVAVCDMQQYLLGIFHLRFL